MFDSLEGPSIFPSQFNYTYDTSIYLNNRNETNLYPRVYSDETRNDKMEGCEPCAGFGSIYYDECYAKEGNQCIGRSYPECQKTYPKCKQIEEKIPKVYKEFNKEKFYSGGGINNTNNNIIIYIIILLLVCILLFNNKKKKNNKGKIISFIHSR